MRITTIEMVRFLRARRSWWLLPVLACFVLFESMIALGRRLRARVAHLRDLPSAWERSEAAASQAARQEIVSPSLAREASAYWKVEA